MHSLQTVGFIRPIVVTDQLELVAGARRLEAMKRLGATVIEVRRVGDLTEQEWTMIELEENFHRKNLTPIERNQTTVRLADAVGAHLREEAETQSDHGIQTTPYGPEHTPTRASAGTDDFRSGAEQNSSGRTGRQE
jgi:hypothetical protein